MFKLITDEPLAGVNSKSYAVVFIIWCIITGKTNDFKSEQTIQKAV